MDALSKILVAMGYGEPGSDYEDTENDGLQIIKPPEPRRVPKFWKDRMWYDPQNDEGY